MRSNYKKLGGYIRPVDERNNDGALGEDNLYGISVTKEFIISHANLVGVTFDGYKVVAPRQFVYIPDTSRRGDKIAISLNTFGEKIIVSSICSVFEIIDENKLLPEYLMLWFMRPEFDRYARFMSNGSAREVFDWDCMCGVELPVPPLSEQQKIVRDHQVITERIAILQKTMGCLEAICEAEFDRISADASPRGSIALETLISFGNGKSRPSEIGDVPVYGGNGIMSYTNQSNAENAVIIGRVGAYCGSVYYETGQCWISDNAIVAKSKITTEEYFDYSLLRRLNLYNYHIGTGQQLLTQGILNNILCPEYTSEDITLFNQKMAPVFKSLRLYSREISQLNNAVIVLLSSIATKEKGA